jgi:hypothetical protein
MAWIRISAQRTEPNMKTTQPVMMMTACAWLLAAANAGAFYNPQPGRWLNRDPLILASPAAGVYLTAYSFAKNRPIGEFDILGLLTDEERKAACREAWKEDQARKPEDRRFSGNYGQAICVGREAVGCVWEERTKGWAPEMIACTQLHEDSHVRDIKKLQPPFGCSSDKRCPPHYQGEPGCKQCSKFYCPEFKNAYADAKATECTAWKATFECMAKYAKNDPKPVGWDKLAAPLQEYAKKCPKEFPNGVVWPK